jgi:hypothetical protein
MLVRHRDWALITNTSPASKWYRCILTFKRYWKDATLKQHRTVFVWYNKNKYKGNYNLDWLGTVTGTSHDKECTLQILPIIWITRYITFQRLGAFSS